MFPDKKIVVAFQPHLYSRTKILFSEFAASFTDADEVYLARFYAAREPVDGSVSMKVLAKKIAENGVTAHKADSMEEIVAVLSKHHYDKNYLLVTLGAGDICRIAAPLIDKQ